MKNIEQYKVAAWLGEKHTTLSNIFCGNRRPSRKKALRLAEISGVSFDEWMLADGKQLKRKVFIAYSISQNEVKK